MKEHAERAAAMLRELESNPQVLSYQVRATVAAAHAALAVAHELAGLAMTRPVVEEEAREAVRAACAVLSPSASALAVTPTVAVTLTGAEFGKLAAALGLGDET